MRSESDLRLRLSRSALQGYFSCLASVLIGATVWLCVRGFGISSVFAIIAGVAAGLLTFGWLWRAHRSVRSVELIFRSAGGCWLAAIHTLGDAETSDLPVLVGYQNYFGLLYLENRAKQSVLLWPDQLDAESARRLRVWVKAQVRH